MWIVYKQEIPRARKWQMPYKLIIHIWQKMYKTSVIFLPSLNIANYIKIVLYIINVGYVFLTSTLSYFY